MCGRPVIKGVWFCAFKYPRRRPKVYGVQREDCDNRGEPGVMMLLPTSSEASTGQKP